MVSFVHHTRIMDSFTAVIETPEFFSWTFNSLILLVFVLAMSFLCIRLFYEKKIIRANVDYDITEMATQLANRPREIIQAFFESLISNTCIVITFAIYHWLENNLPFFDAISSFILLLLIACAIIANNIIDNKMTQDALSQDDKASIRLMSSISILVVYIAIRFGFELMEYDKLIVCYVGLVLGRFLYFDTTMKQLKDTFRNCIKLFFPFILAIAFTFFVILLGIKCEVLTINNMPFGLIWAHICIMLCVHLVKRFIHWKI